MDPHVDPMRIASTFGVVFIAVSISSMIYGTSCLQVFFYYRSWQAREDCLILRSGITLSLVIDTLHQVFVLHLGYKYLISHFGDYAAPFKVLPWSAPAQVICLSVSALVLNSFLTTRIWKLSHNIPLTAILGLFTIATAATNIAFALRGYHHDSLIGGLNLLKPHGIAGIAISIITELSLGISFFYQLYKYRTGTAMTDNIITVVIRTTVPTGMLMTPFNVADLIAYISGNNTLYVLLFNCILAKLYTSAFLTTLNIRDYLHNIAMETHTLESFMPSGSHPPMVFTSHTSRPLDYAEPGLRSRTGSTSRVVVDVIPLQFDDVMPPGEGEVIHLRPLSQDLGVTPYFDESLTTTWTRELSASDLDE